MRPTIATLARVESGERWANLSMRRWLVAICRLSTTQRVRYSWRGAADYGAQPLRWLRSSLPLGGANLIAVRCSIGRPIQKRGLSCALHSRRVLSWCSCPPCPLRLKQEGLKVPASAQELGPSFWGRSGPQAAQSSVTRSEGQISLRGGIIVGAGTITGATVTVCGVEATGRTQRTTGSTI